MVLNIAAGAIIRFQALSDDRSSGSDTSRSELIIQGSLAAAGTTSAPVTFTSSSSSPAKNDWVGIRVLGRGVINLDHSTIEYAANGIDYSLGSGIGEMSMTNCLIQRLSGVGIKTTVSNANTIFKGTFTGNEIRETNGNGMYLYTHTSGRLELEISGNTIHHVAGAVAHPSEWSFGGYNEIQKPQRKCVLIAYQKLAELTGFETYDELREFHRELVNESLANGNGNNCRQPFWSESVAVGSRDFVETIKEKLGIRGKGRKIRENDEGFQLREKSGTYIVNSGRENGNIGQENTLFYGVNDDITVG